MTASTAPGSKPVISGSQNGVPIINRFIYDSVVQSAADVVKVGSLPAGHRLLPEQCRFIAPGLQPVGNFDIYVNAAGNVSTPTNLLWDDQAVAATTFESTAVDAGAYTLCENTIGVDFDNDRDILMLVNSGFATAPAGGKLVFQIASMPVSRA